MTVAAILLAGVVCLAILVWLVLRQQPQSREVPREAPPDVFLVVPPGLDHRNGAGAPVAWNAQAQPTVAPWGPAPQAAPEPQARRGSGATAEALEGSPHVTRVHYDPPSESTLQILPGRLEVLSGPGPAEELRFVRLAGRDPVITFGRSEGEPHAHVRLDSPTVSRTHAVMRLAGGEWHIENLSRTNPVRVNGTPMADSGSSVRLADGDLIEIGAVCLRFRDR